MPHSKRRNSCRISPPRRIWSELQKLLEAPFAPKALSICPVVWRQLFPELQWGERRFSSKRSRRMLRYA